MRQVKVSWKPGIEAHSRPPQVKRRVQDLPSRGGSGRRWASRVMAVSLGACSAHGHQVVLVAGSVPRRELQPPASMAPRPADVTSGPCPSPARYGGQGPQRLIVQAEGPGQAVCAQRTKAIAGAGPPDARCPTGREAEAEIPVLLRPLSLA